MASWHAHRLGRSPAARTWWFATPVVRRSLLQWTIAGMVGVVLGIGTIGVSTLPSRWLALFVLAVLGTAIALVIGHVRKLLLAIILLDIPLQWDINLAHRADAAALGGLPGFNVSLTTFSLAGLYILWLCGLLAGGEPRSRPIVRASLPLALYVTFVVLSLITARDATLALFEISLLVQMFLLFIYVSSTVTTQKDVRFIVLLLLIGLIIESLIMIGTYVTGRDFSIAGLSTKVDAGYGSRVAGTLGAPNAAAGYLSLLLAPAASLLLTPVGRWYKWLAGLAFVLGVVALVITLSRAGWIAFALSSTIVCLLAWRRGWLSPRVLVVSTVIATLLSPFFQNAVGSRLFDSDGGSAYSRIPLMRLSFQIINHNPMLGIGANNYAIVLKEYATPEFAREWLYVVHSKYLLVWAETGMGGLIAFVAFLVATIRQGWQCWMRNDPFLSPLALGLTAAIIGHMVHMFVDLFNGRLHVELLWLIAALISTMRSIDGSDR